MKGHSLDGLVLHVDVPNLHGEIVARYDVPTIGRITANEENNELRTEEGKREGAYLMSEMEFKISVIKDLLALGALCSAYTFAN